MQTGLQLKKKKSGHKEHLKTLERGHLRYKKRLTLIQAVAMQIDCARDPGVSGKPHLTLLCAIQLL